MPVVTVQIGTPDAVTSLTLPALVDSSADTTMIPIRHLKQVKAIKPQQVFIRSVSGRRVGAYFYTISLQFVKAARHKISEHQKRPMSIKR
jgi:hypothetical protein